MKRRHALFMLDAVLNIFEPATNPELIAPIRPVRRGTIFRQGELSRPCRSALREAGKPALTRYIVDYVMWAKGLDPERQVRGHLTLGVRNALHGLDKRGSVCGIVEWPEVWRELVG
jgi:hypothetical protein